MELRDFLKSIPQEVKEKENTKQFVEAKKEYKEFREAFDKGFCYLCGMKLSYFNESEPCFHWLLLPEGLKKKHLKEYLSEKIGLFKIESYLRWIANTEDNIKNINDLDDEVSNTKIEETTIKYKNIEWSVNIGKTDLEGHKDSKNANFPHFHIQIYKDSKPFVRYNDFHIPLSKEDIFKFEVIKNNDLAEHLYLYGEGISIIKNKTELEIIEDELSPSDNVDNATFHTRTFFEVPEHIILTEEQFEEIKSEAKKQGKLVRNYIKEVIPEINIISKEVYPGKGVVKKKKRSKRK